MVYLVGLEIIFQENNFPWKIIFHVKENEKSFSAHICSCLVKRKMNFPVNEFDQQKIKKNAKNNFV